MASAAAMALGGGIFAGIDMVQAAQATTGPVARYDMRAGTTSGFGAMGAGGGGQIEDLVWWSSSAAREFGGGLSDWLSPGAVARLVAARTVMSPQTASCTIPAEIHAAAPDFMMTTMTGYGPEETFVYPARPADPRAVWHIQWQARIRHRSMTSFMPGMPDMGDTGARDSLRNQANQACPPNKRHGLGGLGGMTGGALTGGAKNGDGCP